MTNPPPPPGSHPLALSARSACTDVAHASKRSGSNGKRSYCKGVDGCSQCVWCPVADDRTLTICALQHHPRDLGSTNKRLGKAYKLHLRTITAIASTTPISPRQSNFDKFHCCIQLDAKYHRAKPWSSAKKDTPVVLAAFKHACIAVGNIICEGEGHHLLSRARATQVKDAGSKDTRHGRLFRCVVIYYIYTVES